MRLLLVEDETRLIELLRTALDRAGFVVDVAANLAAAVAALQVTNYDAMILDIGLPDGNGIDLLRQLRNSNNSLPVLILTARDAIDDRVSGLDAGGDDYLIKPFAIAELIARIKALLRRPGGALGIVLTAGNIRLDTIGRDASVNDVSLELSRREIALLEHLMRRLGRVVPKDVLEDKLYTIDDPLESNAIPVHIHHLRRKLIDASAHAEIHTVRGVGYLLSDSRE
jgi:DNA-binding response OmpR family regulator